MAFGSVKDTTALVVDNVLFGRTTLMDNFFSSKKEINGILGLGFESLAVAGMKPPFVQAYQHHLVDQSIFTVYMYQNGYKRGVPGGQITFGGLDTSKCGPVIDNVTLTSATYWKFHLSSIRVNGGRPETNSDQGFEVIR